MPVTQQIILIATPEETQKASGHGVPIAHMAYRIGAGGHLYRARSQNPPHGGLMVVSPGTMDSRGDPSQLCREIIRECNVRRFEGVLCDFDPPRVPFLEHTIERLSDLARQRSLSLYLTEEYGTVSDYASVLIPTAISSGSLEAILREAVHQYGAQRVCLGAQRIAQEFLLPASTGGGSILTRSELAQRVKRFAPSIFFDNNLCAHYFTYMERGQAHFILFEDSGSLLRKLSLARELEIRRVFFAYPEVSDILPRLLGG